MDSLRFTFDDILKNNGYIGDKQKITNTIIRIIWDSEDSREKCPEDHNPLHDLIRLWW